ncbi:tetratricopeptide repeat protein [Ruminococcus sp.]|uniref:tetratricopeptide repeat protein n=1 Tax=Ruminococcus sp. TaxID=41978 RepID=UPI0025CF82B6|nr:tetratricopeptide repeat protein [Ruminococcus sp.]MBR1433094.1 sel1 repeat family protein [Ruminococcus sp.]
MEIYDTIFEEIDTDDCVQMYLYGAGVAFKYLRMYYRRSPLNGGYKAIPQLLREMGDVFESMKATVVREPILDNEDFLQGMTDVWAFVGDFIKDNNSYPKPSEIESMLENGVTKIRFREFVLVAGTDFYAKMRSGNQPVVQWIDSFRRIILTMSANDWDCSPFYGYIDPWHPDVLETLFSTTVPNDEYEIDIKMIRCVFENERFFCFDFEYWYDDGDDDWGYEEEVDESKEIFSKDNYISAFDLNSSLLDFSDEDYGGIFSTNEEAYRNSLYIAFCIYGYGYIRDRADPAEFQKYKPKKKDEEKHILTLENKIGSEAGKFNDSVISRINEALSGNAETAYMLADIISDETHSIEDKLDFMELSVYYGKRETINEIVDICISVHGERERTRWGVKTLAGNTGLKVSDILFDYAKKYKNRSLDNEESFPQEVAKKAKNLYDYSVKEGRQLEYNEYRYFHDDELRGIELIEEFTKTAEYMITDHYNEEGFGGYFTSLYLTPYVCNVFGNLLRRYKIAELAFSYYSTGEQAGIAHKDVIEVDYPRDVLFQVYYALGQMYENGEGTDIDLDKALEYYKQAAEQGMGEAQLSMALLVQRKYSGEEGRINAAGLYSSLDDTNKYSSPESSLSAQEIWGLRYENGYGVEQSFEKAVECYENAIETSERSIALRHLGDIYKNKYSNIEKAYEYYLRGTKTGDPDMLCFVAEMYLNGTMGAKNESLAMKYALKAVKRGSLSAMRIMGDIALNNGDKESAELWYAGAKIGEQTLRV